MASNGEESEFYYGIKNNASIANATPTVIVTKDADGTYEHATVANIPLSAAAISALALKAPIASPTFTDSITVQAQAPFFSFKNLAGSSLAFIQYINGALTVESGTSNTLFNKGITIKTSGGSATPNSLIISDLLGTGDRSVLVDSIGTIKPGLAVPKVYNALLSQSGLNAPTAAIISNTLGGVPFWSYTSAGQYKLTLLGTFISGKTLVFATIGANTAAGDTSIKCFLNTSTGEIILNTTFNAAFTDILLTNASFKIEVYP
jgi:hypothetical protein